MTRQKWIATVLCLVLALSVSLAPSRARAGSERADTPIRLHATALAGPIGRIANPMLAPGALIINGRSASADQPIWAGDLIESRARTNVALLLDSIGEITLRRDAMLRLAVSRPRYVGEEKRSTMIATLARGEIAVKLQPTADAYMRAAGSVFSSSEGAAFNASVRDRRALIAVKSGTVRDEEQSSQPQYTVRPVGHGSDITVEPEKLKVIQVQVIEDNTPVPGVAVLFVLDQTGVAPGKLGVGTMGSTTLSVVTNAEGIAAVHFVAGPHSGTIPISATVEGTRASWDGVITVTSGGISHSTAWVIGILAGTAAAAGIAYALTRGDKDPLQAQPPGVKNP